MTEVARLEAALEHASVPGLYLREPSAVHSGWVARAHARSFVVAALIDAASLDPALAERIRLELLAEARALVDTLRGEVPARTSSNVLPFTRKP